MMLRREKLVLSFFGLVFAAIALGATINGQLKDALFENLSSDPTGQTGRVYYNTATNQPKIYNGTGWTSLGGSGNGEKNYITNGSSSATGWTASSGGATIATDTNSADLPDISVGSALLLTAVSGSNAFTFYNFNVDPADYNKKLKTTFDQACGFSTASTAAIVSCASNDFKVDVYSCTVAWSGSPATTCSGTSTRLALSTDPSGSTVSSLPALTGTYRTTFDSPGSAAQYLQLRIGMNATQTHAIALANVLVGPGIVTQGPALTGWTSYSPTVGGAPAADVQQYFYRRVGDAVQIQAYVHFTGAGTSTALTFTLPLSLTGNTSAIGGTSTAAGLIGNATIWNGTAVAQYQPQLTGSNATTFGFTNSSASAFQANAIASGYQISFDITVPVNEWTGAGTVNVVQNDCEYAFNTSISDADDTTSFGYGPAGTAFPGALTSNRSKTVQWKTPASATDQITFEYEKGTGPWFPLSTPDVNSGLAPQTSQGANLYGVGVKTSTSTTTASVVNFGQYAAVSSSTSYNAAGTSWTTLSGYQWRLKKCAGGQAVGFGAASATASGLVSFEDSTNAISASLTGARSVTVTIYAVRVGKTVTLQWPRSTAVSCSAGTLASSASLLPSEYTPAHQVVQVITGQNNGADAATGLVIGTNGSLVFGTVGGNNYTGSANCGFYEGSTTYTVL